MRKPQSRNGQKSVIKLGNFQVSLDKYRKSSIKRRGAY